MRFSFLFPVLILFLFPAKGFAFEDVNVDIGGQLRFRPEIRNNYDFDKTVDDYSGFVGQRIRLDFKIEAGDDIDAFIQIQDSRNWGYTGNVGTAAEAISIGDTATPADGTDHTHTATSTDTLDLYQVWFNLKNPFGLPVNLKIGRQTLVYGTERLLGDLGWTDSARSFDAYKLIWKVGPGQIDIISAKLADRDPIAGTLPGNTVPANVDENLHGIYTMWDIFAGHKLDAYYLIMTGEANGRDMNTAGLRLAGKTGGFDYTGEFALQGGDWKTGVSQDANAYAITAGYTADYSWKSRIGFEYAAGSGDDDQTDTTHKTFFFPFHTNHAHYGHMDMFSWGNMTDLVIKLSTNPMGGKTKVKLDYHMLSLAEAKDAWLNVVGVAPTAGFKAAGNYSETEAGTEIDLTVVHPYNNHLKIVAGYSIFMPGSAVKERTEAVGGTANDDTADWSYLMLILNF